MDSARLVLASASPRRRELLAAAGFAFEVLAVDVDERLLAGETPRACVERLASAKSRAAEARLTDAARAEALVLGADTVVVVDGDILGKPANIDEAGRMLRRLSGRRHDVLTGVSLRGRGRELTRVETTAVDVAILGDREVDWYVQSREGLDKAGAYAIQGLASRFVTRIEGSYSNVVGLPIAAVSDLIARLTARPGSA